MLRFSIIQLSLSLLIASRKSYRRIKRFLRLPSISLLTKYKNSVDQQPGFLPDNLSWMELEASRLNISDAGRRGCLVIDEMQIQVRSRRCLFYGHHRVHQATWVNMSYSIAFLSTQCTTIYVWFVYLKTLTVATKLSIVKPR